MGSNGADRLWACSGAALALVMLAASARAQVVPDSIPANTQDLRNFRIDPPPVTPPAPPPAAETPPPAPAPAPAPAPVPEPVPAPPPVEDRTAAPTRTPPARVQRTQPAAEPQRPVPGEPGTASPAEIPADAPASGTPPAAPPELPPVSQVEPDAPTPIEARPATESPRNDAGSNSLLPISVGLVLAALIGALLWRRRRRPVVIVEETEAVDALPVEDAEDVPDATQVASQAPLAPPVPQAHARPNLALTFKPAAAGATDAVASVEYAIVLTNTGDAPASKVRMEARMFAMGQGHDAALAEFFASPMERPTPVASAVPPGVEAALRAQVTLPRDAVNAIQVRDRTVFVPLVAFNVLYEWYDADGGLQHGQTAMSYVVGRENRPPAEKMAPFRLDQGPRMYREVGQRVHELKRVA